MQTYITLLRGINVGGHRKILMADLRTLLGKLNFKNVQTYIQSGNVVFNSEKDAVSIKNEIENAIKQYFQFDVNVTVKTSSQLQLIFNYCPFKEEKSKSYFAILSKIPDASLVKETIKKTYEDEEYYIINDAIYFYCAKGYGKAKFSLNFFEKKLKVNATARNYKTMLKLLDIAKETQIEL